jgi:hypothetical protein
MRILCEPIGKTWFLKGTAAKQAHQFVVVDPIKELF